MSAAGGRNSASNSALARFLRKGAAPPRKGDTERASAVLEELKSESERRLDAIRRKFRHQVKSSTSAASAYRQPPLRESAQRGGHSGGRSLTSHKGSSKRHRRNGRQGLITDGNRRKGDPGTILEVELSSDDEDNNRALAQLDGGDLGGSPHKKARRGGRKEATQAHGAPYGIWAGHAGDDTIDTGDQIVVLVEGTASAKASSSLSSSKKRLPLPNARRPREGRSQKKRRRHSQQRISIVKEEEEEEEDPLGEFSQEDNKDTGGGQPSSGTLVGSSKQRFLRQQHQRIPPPAPLTSKTAFDDVRSHHPAQVGGGGLSKLRLHHEKTTSQQVSQQQVITKKARRVHFALDGKADEVIVDGLRVATYTEDGTIYVKPLPPHSFYAWVMDEGGKRLPSDVARWSCERICCPGVPDKPPPQDDFYTLRIRFEKPIVLAKVCAFLILAIGCGPRDCVGDRTREGSGMKVEFVTTLNPKHIPVTPENTFSSAGFWYTETPHLIIEWQRCPLKTVNDNDNAQEESASMEEEEEEDPNDGKEEENLPTTTTTNASTPSAEEDDNDDDEDSKGKGGASAWARVPIAVIHIVVQNKSLWDYCIRPEWAPVISHADVFHVAFGAERATFLRWCNQDVDLVARESVETPVSQRPQRLPDWFRIRTVEGKCGGSSLSDRLDLYGKQGTQGEEIMRKTRSWGKKNPKRGKIVMPIVPEGQSKKVMRIGSIFEDWILYAYLERHPTVSFMECGWFDLEGVPGQGCSPDGLLRDTSITLDTLIQKHGDAIGALVEQGLDVYSMTPEHLQRVALELKMGAKLTFSASWLLQIHMEMMCTNTILCDVVRLSSVNSKMYVWRIVRNEAWCKLLRQFCMACMAMAEATGLTGAKTVFPNLITPEITSFIEEIHAMATTLSRDPSTRSEYQCEWLSPDALDPPEVPSIQRLRPKARHLRRYGIEAMLCHELARYEAKLFMRRDDPRLGEMLPSIRRAWKPSDSDAWMRFRVYGQVAAAMTELNPTMEAIRQRLDRMLGDHALAGDWWNPLSDRPKTPAGVVEWLERQADRVDKLRHDLTMYWESLDKARARHA